MAYRKKEPLGIVPDVQPEGSYFWDGSQMTPFHNKLLDVGKLKTITLLLVLALEPQTKDKGKQAE